MGNDQTHGSFGGKVPNLHLEGADLRATHLEHANLTGSSDPP